VIKSFRHKGLRDLFVDNDARGIRPDLAGRCRARLSALHRATKPMDLGVPGFRLHRLHGKPSRYAIDVNGPWRITFEWDGEGAARVDLEQYH
jgi:proteic killer suppression protein